MPDKALPPFVVCIPAGGSGDRMQSEIPKQYLTVAGKPVIAHSLAVFDAIPKCFKIIIAAANREKINEVLTACPLNTPVEVVAGGETRQQSVANALAACGADDTIVLIHDAARPCIERALVEKVVHSVHECGAALAALPARDTIKRVSGADVVETIDRTTIWLAQTPQGALAGIFRKAFERAAAENILGTDDASLLERIGIGVKVVPGVFTNLKITTREDLLIADAILRSRIEISGTD